MISAARSAIIRIEDGFPAAPELAAVPPWQWAVPGGWWTDLSKHCEHRPGGTFCLLQPNDTAEAAYKVCRQETCPRAKAVPC